MDNDSASELIRRAYAAVRAAGLPEELHGDALAAVIPLIEGPGETHVRKRDQSATRTPRLDRQQPALLEQIAARIGVNMSLLEPVYEQREGDLHLVVSPALLDKKARPAMRQLALLVCAGRQAAGLDDGGTPIAILKGALQQYPAQFDVNNLHNALSGVDSLRRSGERDTASFRALPAAYAELSRFLRQFATPVAK